MIVTDPGVMRFLRDSRPSIVHKFDAWHMAKGQSVYVQRIVIAK